jgi:hypothetical protein
MSSRLPASERPASALSWPRQGLPFALFMFAYYGYVGVFSP